MGKRRPVIQFKTTREGILAPEPHHCLCNAWTIRASFRFRVSWKPAEVATGLAVVVPPRWVGVLGDHFTNVRRHVHLKAMTPFTHRTDEEITFFLHLIGAGEVYIEPGEPLAVMQFLYSPTVRVPQPGEDEWMKRLG